VKTILALGNPTAEYAQTRHNIGFMVADALVRRRSGEWKPYLNMLLAEFGEGRIVKPQTWMNASGSALTALGGRFLPGELLVVADEVNLPLGRLRLRAGGSGGGHNGLASVEAALEASDYHRLRVGVSAGAVVTGEKLVDFVLGEFPPEQQNLLAAVVEAAGNAVESWLAEGLPQAQERYNGLDLRPTDEDRAG
jgi:peptidyl-tRNA hydrolase, PTH1 family